MSRVGHSSSRGRHFKRASWETANNLNISLATDKGSSETIPSCYGPVWRDPLRCITQPQNHSIRI